MAIYTTTIAKTETLPVDWEKLPMQAKEKIIAYGVQRIFNDMVGGAERFPTVEKKVAHVKEQIERFYKGEIGRASGGGVSTEVSIGRSLVRAALKLKYGAKSETWAKFTGLGDEEQNAKLDEVFEKNREAFAEEVKKEMKRRADAAAKRAKQAEGLDLDI